MIEQTHDLAPEQAKRLYNRVIIGINPDAQDKLDEMLFGDTSNNQDDEPDLNLEEALSGTDGSEALSMANLPERQLASGELIGEHEQKTLIGGSGAEWAFRKAGKQIKQAVDETRLNLKEDVLNIGAEVGDAIGLDRSAKYLKHFLDGSGKDIVVSRDEARKDPFIRDGEKENRKRFEGDTFLGKSGNKDVNKALTNLQDGQSIEFSDKWDQDLSFSRKKEIDYLEELGRTLEPDLLLSLGSLKFTSNVDAKAERRGDTIYIKGVVTHNGDDRYDFSDGDEAYGAYELQQSQEAKPFRVQQEWRQEVKGTVKITGTAANGQLILGNPKFKWTDE